MTTVPEMDDVGHGHVMWTILNF